MKLVNNVYKDSLDNVLNNNIDDIVNNTNFCLVKQIISTTQSKTLCNIPLSSRLFSKITSNNDKNFSFFVKKIYYSICY